MPESTHNPPTDRATRFVAALRRLRDRQDRGALAALRRGLSPATVMDAWPVVSRLGGEIGQPGESVDVDIAALFATHHVESETRDFGETCRAISWDPTKGELVESHERRFRRLLASDSPADLAHHLRTWVRLAAGKGVGVNYEALHRDRQWWHASADRIRVRWARSFWRSGGEAGAELTEQTTTATTTTS